MRILPLSRPAITGKVVRTIKLKDTVPYALIHSFYWSIFCSSYTFATVFLLSRHFSNSQIGIVFAVSGFSAAFLQPAVAAFADTSGEISIEEILIVLTGVSGLFAVGRFFLPDAFFLLAALFILEITALYTMQPLLNALGMQMINDGRKINFGLARGVGSLSYAVVSVLLGVLEQNFGPQALTAVSIGLYIALAAVLLTFRKNRGAAATVRTLSPQSVGASEAGVPGVSGLRLFLNRYKRFMVFLAAVVLTFCSHTMISNYLMQITEHVGGTAKEMGIANAISAALELPAMILFGFLVKKIRCGPILKFSLFFFSVKAAVTLLASNVWTLYAAQMLQFCSYAFFIPASVFYVNEIVCKDDLAKGQAFMTSAITVGGVAASFLGGWLLDRSGTRGMLVLGLICAVLGFVIGVLAVGRGRPRESTAEGGCSRD